MVLASDGSRRDCYMRILVAVALANVLLITFQSWYNGMYLNAAIRIIRQMRMSFGI